jgi:hypothetical protein
MIGGIPHDTYFWVLARQVAFDLAVLITSDDRYGRGFDACTIIPAYLVFKQRNSINLD